MVIPFPAYRPTSWELQLPNYRVITNNWRATEAPEILGSLPEDARLRLRYENITDQQALELLLLWRATAGGYYPLNALPAEVAAGINNAALASRILDIAPLSWVVADPPRQESIKNLRSGVDIELKSELRFVPSIVLPTVTCPIYVSPEGEAEVSWDDFFGGGGIYYPPADAVVVVTMVRNFYGAGTTCPPLAPADQVFDFPAQPVLYSLGSGIAAIDASDGIKTASGAIDCGEGGPGVTVGAYGSFTVEYTFKPPETFLVSADITTGMFSQFSWTASIGVQGITLNGVQAPGPTVPAFRSCSRS